MLENNGSIKKRLRLDGVRRRFSMLYFCFSRKAEKIRLNIGYRRNNLDWQSKSE